MLLGLAHQPTPRQSEQPRYPYGFISQQIVGGCLGMERVEFTLYLLGFAQRHSLFLFAGELVGFKFKRMDSRPHTLANIAETFADKSRKKAIKSDIF